MRIFYGLDHTFDFRKPVVTVGSFDGLHHGHRALLTRIISLARAEGGESVVLTFWPHPRMVLPDGGDIRLLNTIREKASLLAEIGIDNMVIIPFTPDFSRMSSYDFVKRILIDRIGVHRLVVGYDHRFGHDKEGDTGFLTTLKEQFGFEIDEIPEKEVERHKVSSTQVRKIIQQGDMTRAMTFLERPYFLIADVTDGRVKLEEEAKLLPPCGSYPVQVNDNGSKHDDTLSIATDGTVRLVGGGNMRSATISFVGNPNKTE